MARTPSSSAHSGAGKSVTLKLIVGLLEPDGGRVLVDDDVVQDLDRDELAALRGRIGYVFQFAALFDSMTVAENIRLGLVKRGYEESTIRERIEESLAVVDLSGTEDKLPAELSGGMRKRVGIARAIALKPRYILYDEPTTGLDPITAAVMDQTHHADPRPGRHRARGHPRHAQRLQCRRPRRHAVRGRHPPGRYGGRDPGVRRSGGAPVHRRTPRPGAGGAGGAEVGRVKRSNEFAVGLAVLAALALVIGGALWLSETDVNQKKATYAARFRTVGGLGVGGPVTLRGVRVGRVEAIKLVENEWVETEFSIDRSVELPRKPAVISASASLFGEWTANIVPLRAAPDRSQSAQRSDRVRSGGRRRLARRHPSRHRAAHCSGQPDRRRRGRHHPADRAGLR